jgi:hypothetical protein
MKLKSFGCSFIYGTDLPDWSEFDEDPIYSYSNVTWPALIAKKLNLKYECYASPGIGNFRILCNIINQASFNDPAVFVINWTWIDRFDYINKFEKWQSILPGDDTLESDFYYRNFHSQFKDMLTSVYFVNIAIDFLNEKKIPFVMSYMDYCMTEALDKNWHDPKYLSVIQEKIKKYLVDFQGKNFLDWSKTNGFEISQSCHPLELAHAGAAEYMLHKVVEKLELQNI